VTPVAYNADADVQMDGRGLRNLNPEEEGEFSPGSSLLLYVCNVNFFIRRIRMDIDCRPVYSPIVLQTTSQVWGQGTACCSIDQVCVQVILREHKTALGMFTAYGVAFKLVLLNWALLTS
jgi:hypothetical protein